MNDEVEQLRILLGELRVQQRRTEEAIDRVETAIGRRNQPRTQRETVVELERELELSDFRVGQLVRILNPRRGEQSTGRVSYVGTRFVGVARSRGQDTRRIPRNLEILFDDNDDGPGPQQQLQ